MRSSEPPEAEGHSVDGISIRQRPHVDQPASQLAQPNGGCDGGVLGGGDAGGMGGDGGGGDGPWHSTTRYRS